MLDVSPTSRHNVFRRRRIELLNDLIRMTLVSKTKCKIIDIGGTFGFWSTWSHLINWNQVSITCVNLNPGHMAEGESRATMIQGNACNLDQIADNQYDIAFSNSVIEHVGMWSDMKEMATEVRRVARRYLVQTPYYWFPIEPHARTPLLHWLPEPVAYRIVMNFKCGFWTKAQTVDDAVSTVQSARLLDRRQFQALFPDAEIRSERFVGLTKSLIAVRDAS